MLFQRSPLIQMIFPEAKILSGAGLGEITKWTVASVAGLGAFDSVAGATTIAQVTPTAGSSTVAATVGKPLSFVFQLLNYPDTPGSWKVTGYPTGLTHADAKSNKIDSLSGIPTQSGTFSVKITAYANTNYTGDSYNMPFTMNVAADPTAKIATHPASTTIDSGQTTTLTVVASGTGPFTYQWYRGSSGATTSPVGTNAASFTTPALTTNTSYWVKVSNASTPAGVNSTTATVTVREILNATIVQHPASIRIKKGESTVLSIVAGGLAPLSYQWYEGQAGVTANPVGANFSSFTTPVLNTNTSYWVRVSNSLGSGDSEAALISVLPMISIQQPAGADLVDGSGSRSFGNVLLGANSSLSFTIRNNGIQNLTDLTVTQDGVNPGDYLVTGPVATTLSPAASTTFNVMFQPSTTGSKTATLHVNSSVIGEESFEINLEGNGVLPAPEIGVQQPKGSELVDGSAKKKFGTVKLGKKSSAKTFTIKNTGSANLTGLSVSRSGTHAKDFTVTAPAMTTLAPGASTTFKVTFNPRKKGTRIAGIHIKSNDANENPFDINVTGLGAP